MAATEIQENAVAGVAGFLAEFERFQREAGGPAAVQALRRLAIERFAALGFPTSRQEQWRQTNVAPIAQGTFHRPESDPEAVEPEQIAPFDFPAAARLVFVDGRFSARLSSLGSLPEGTVVTSLAQALERVPEKVEPWLGQLAGFDDHPFVALNTAFLRDGAFVWVPRNAMFGPVHLLFLSSSEDGRATVSFPRNLIVTGEGSQLSLVETYAGSGAYFNCPVTEMAVGPNSVVDHYKVQRESRDAFHMATFQLQGDRDSVPSSHSIALGGALVRNDVNAVLDGEGIDCILNGLYLLDGSQFVDNHMRVEHAKPHCASHELYKGVLDGKSRSIFNGLIHVHKGAQKTDAKQSNRNLLLSQGASALPDPFLEIKTSEVVRATHGVSVGRPDEETLFYLHSRGLDQQEAERLFVKGFFQEIIDRVRVPEIRATLEAAVEDELALED